MPVFTLQGPAGRKIKIEAADEATAMRGAQEYSASAPKTGGYKPSLTEEVRGGMAALNRGLLIGDEVTAGLRTAGNVMTGKVPVQNAYADYKTSLARENAIENEFSARHPVIAGNIKNTAALAPMLIPGGAEPAAASMAANTTRAGNMARGALSAATAASTYGLLDRGSLTERGKAATAAGSNPAVLALGAVGGAFAPVSPKKGGRARIARPKTDAQVLKESGVETTLPQRMGGLAKNAEDLAMRAPIVGPAISGARNRQIEQLNRAVALKALQPVGMGVPKEIKPGFEMVEYVDDALGKIYERAAAKVPSVTLDKPLQEEFTQIASRMNDLPDSEAAQFERIIRDRTQRLQSGASGATVKQIHSELGHLQAEAAKKGQDTLASMLGDTRRSLMGLVERANPEAGALVRQADQGWQVYSMMNDAAASASNRGGVFLPGQLNTQARTAGRRIGSNMTGKGKAPLQDLATAATRTLPDQFGNPGTANAVGLGSLGVGVVTAPVQTAGIAAGLTAAATPYWLTARRVVESLPESATVEELARASRSLAQLAQSDPQVRALQAQVAARLSRVAGTAGASATSPRPAISATGR